MDDREHRYINKYRHCGQEWWEATADYSNNYACPKCGTKDIEPYDSIDTWPSEEEAAARFTVEHGDARCPNCAEPIIGHADNTCILDAFIRIISDRDETPPDVRLRLHRLCNIDALWDDLSPIIDNLENGLYSSGEESNG